MRSDEVSVIVCTPEDVLSGPCICKMNGWPHEFGPAGPGYREGLEFCGNCECCVRERR
jgi:hypothetical protein